MKTHADKTQENKSQSVANEVSQKQNSGESTFQFVDNQPEAITQRNLQEVMNNSPRMNELRAIQEMADNSPQVSQLKSFQEMADNSPQVKQAVQLQAMADDYNVPRAFQRKNDNVLQKKTLDQAGLKGNLQIFNEKRVTVGDDKLTSNIYEEHVQEDNIRGRIGALQIAAEKNGNIGAMIHSWGKKGEIGKKPKKSWQAQQMFTRKQDEMNNNEVETLDPFFFAVTVPFKEEERTEALVLAFQHSADLQGYVETIVDTSNVETHDFPSMYKGKSDKVKDGDRNAKFPQLHDPDTEDQLLINLTDGGEETSLDAYTKIAGEGARWVCVRQHASKLQNTSFFYTEHGAEKGFVRALMFNELWVSWKDVFNKEYNISNDIVRKKIGDPDSKLNDKVIRLPFYDMGPEDFDLDE